MSEDDSEKEHEATAKKLEDARRKGDVPRPADLAVAAAYGWPEDLGDEDMLERLFALNQERAAAGR